MSKYRITPKTIDGLTTYTIQYKNWFGFWLDKKIYYIKYNGFLNGCSIHKGIVQFHYEDSCQIVVNELLKSNQIYKYKGHTIISAFLSEYNSYGTLFLYLNKSRFFYGCDGSYNLYTPETTLDGQIQYIDGVENKNKNKNKTITKIIN